jgi:polar amino acid transport system substrate-binding protein
VLAACSSSGGTKTNNSSAAGGAASTPAAATGGASGSKVALPPSFTGPLVAPAVVGYPPYAYLEGGKIRGISTDLATALGGPWGKSVTLKKDSFENSLLGVNRGVYFGVFGADVTADREKAFDQVSYLDDLCGKKISLVAAASSIPVLKKQSTTCTSQGRKPITVLTFADQGAATLAVQSKQADATTATVTNLGFIAKQSGGKFTLGGPRYLFVLIGIATKKGNGMAQAIADGINTLIADGEYQKILEAYGVEAAAVKKAEVNPNPNPTPSN